MARKKSAKVTGNAETAMLDYRHDEAKRKNIPPAELAAQGKVRETPINRDHHNILKFLSLHISALTGSRFPDTCFC